MPAKKFRFVSPGVQIKEIDKSILPALPGAIGPVVIGRSVKGPAMVPVTVDSYEDFVQKFGEPSPGVSNRDIWRNGNDTGPTYGAYAAKAWLESSTPLTFLRLAGVQSLDKQTGGEAGWKTDTLDLQSSASVNNGGAFGLFLAPTASGSTGSLASIFYLDEGSIQLVGTTPSGATVGDELHSFTSGSGVFVKCDDSLTFKVLIKDGSGTSKKNFVFNFTKDSDSFIRKVFNTNPTLTNNEVTPGGSSGSLETYWLGETFENSLEDIGIKLNSSAEEVCAFIAPLRVGANKELADFKQDARAAKTGWVISQHLSADNANFDPESMPKLFRFVAGEGLGGDYEQNNYKISIFDIKPPLNSYQKYGSFSVGIRHIDDKDTSPEFVEVFSNLNLDPSSPDYIAARIGDRRIVWRQDPDSGEERFIELGSFSNNSKIIRVEMHPTVERGGVDSAALPFGFFGPTSFKSFTLSGNSGSLDISDSCIVTGSDSIAERSSSVDGIHTQLGSTYEVKIQFPSLPLRVSASAVDSSDPTLAYFGMKVEQPLDESLKDLLRAKPKDFDSHEASEGTEYSFVFSLDDVQKDAKVGAKWIPGSRVAGDSWTASGSLSDLLENEYNKFTMPLFGGFDGLDLKEREPFRNTKLDDGTEKENYAYNSVKRAIDSVKDPEVLDMNLLVVPGVTNPGLTNYMIRVCENRADSMAIIDLEGGYVPDTEGKQSEDSRIGSVSQTIQKVKDRGFNTSYACAYYPWVQMQDDNTGNKLWIPPSVVAFGTMASSQEDSEVWFAPAGFNRGGLSLGSSGLSILNVRDKLTAKNRDSLYERSVNPIASFPNEGLVIFGQKTLQAVPSALDRINVRRLVIFLKKEISRIASGLLFEPNVEQTWKRFSVPTTRLLEEVKTGFGISDYRVVLDATTTTPEEIDRNMMYAKLFIKPVYAIEFIGIDFVITNTGASFDDL
jgi:hypothetical protein